MTSLTLVAMSLASLERGLIRSAKHLAIGAGATIALVAVHSRQRRDRCRCACSSWWRPSWRPATARRPPPRDQRCAVSPSVCSSSCRCFVEGSLGEWWRQSITGPLQWSQATGGIAAYRSQLEAIWLPLGLIVSAAGIAALRPGDRPWLRRYQRPLIGIIGAGVAAWLFLADRSTALSAAQLPKRVSGLIGSPDRREVPISWPSAHRREHQSPVAAGLVRVDRDRRGRRLPRPGDSPVHARRGARLLSWLLIGGLGIAGLVQMYPVADSRHYWWGLAVAMLALMSAFRSTRFRLLPVQNPFVISVVAALVVAIGVRPDVPLGRPRLRPGRFGPARNVVQRADRRLSDCGGPRPARAHDRTGREGRLPRAGRCMDRLRWSVPFHRPVLHRGREPQRPRETRRASTSSPTISTWLGAATRSTAADTSSSEAPNTSRCSAGTSTSNDITSTDAGTTIRPAQSERALVLRETRAGKPPSRRWTPGTLQPRFLHGDQP